MPKTGRDDLRSWEWYYLLSRCYQDVLTFRQHQREVHSVAWSPDGRRIASGGLGALKVWDASSGALVHSFDHGQTTNCVTWSPDGKRIADARDDGSLVLWDAETGDMLRTIHIPSKWGSKNIFSVAFSPDGKRLACGTGKLLSVVDTETGEKLLALAFKGRVYSLAWSPDGKQLAVGNDDFGRSEVPLWDAESGQQIKTLKGHTSRIHAVAWSPDGKLLATAGYDRVAHIWDVASGESLHSLPHSGQIWTVAFSPDGRSLATGTHSSQTTVWDVSTGAKLQSFQGHAGRVGSVAWHPDGKRLASASYDGTVKIWKIRAQDASPGFGDDTQRVAWSPDDRLLACETDGDETVVRDATTGNELLRLAGTKPAWSPDGKCLSTIDKGRLRVWNVDGSAATLQKNLDSITPHSGAVESIVFLPDGSRLVSASSDNTIKVWDIASGKCLSTLAEHTDKIESIAVSPDGQMLASASGDNTIRLWDVDTGKVRHVLTGHSDETRGVAFSSDGKTLASVSFDGKVKLWDTSEGTLLHTLEGHTEKLRAVAFSPTGDLVASAGDDHTIRLWNTDSGEFVAEFSNHTAEIRGLAFSPDGRLLASAAGKKGSENIDWTARVWDVATRQQVHMLTGHTGAVRTVAFSPDGESLVVAGPGIHRWRLESREQTELSAIRKPVVSAVWSPEGGRLAIESGQSVTIRDSVSGKELLSLSIQIDARSDQDAMAWDPSGKRIAIGSGYTLAICDASTGKVLHALAGHLPSLQFGFSLYGIGALAWSPDGGRLASVGYDQSVRVWDASSGSEVLTLEGHSTKIARVAWSEDGRRIASISVDGMLIIWDAASGAEVLILRGQAAATDVSWSHDGRRLAVVSAGTIEIKDASPAHELLSQGVYGQDRARWHYFRGIRLARKERIATQREASEIVFQAFGLPAYGITALWGVSWSL
ncbi:MAG: PD40 domain-containing protein [Planctomycetes bacterium]|nr:PD40 domain-containing protein [Planctomycetota bacterium]